LRNEFPDFGFSVSCTTRKPRENEVDGRDYVFLSREEFERLRTLNHFAEWAEVHGNFYGTPLAPVERMLRGGQDVIFDIDVQGAGQIKLTLPKSIFVFILPPSLEELERRLRKRGQDDEASIKRRLVNARREMTGSEWYNALVVNDNLDDAYDALRAVYLTGTLAPFRNPDLVERILGGHPWRN
jgi:guanylate kinase